MGELCALFTLVHLTTVNGWLLLWKMFAKVFLQIFDSSIADNYKHRHVFMDMLVLADSDGVVDMTAEAISRRTNVPLDEVKDAIVSLGLPDDRSNSTQDGGRRLLPVDERKPWGWQIVNYHHYREIRTEEARREYMRDYRRAEREKKRKKPPLVDANGNKIKLVKGYPSSTLHPHPPTERSVSMGDY